MSIISPQKSINVHDKSVTIETTPRRAESRVASTRSLKFRKYHVVTPKNMTMNQSPYHVAG
tara:strand:- start:380 stop:562 length:183 start_codon:yes stop_codon:yes gene_type:complete